MGLVFPLTLTRVRSVFVLGIVLIGNGVIPCSYFVFFIICLSCLVWI